MDRLLDTASRDALVAVRPLVVDLDSRRVIGRVAQRPLGVSRQGRVLVAIGAEASAERLAAGPLRWVEPVPITSEAAAD